MIVASSRVWTAAISDCRVGSLMLRSSAFKILALLM
jgi:hypothetical protein